MVTSENGDSHHTLFTVYICIGLCIQCLGYSQTDRETSQCQQVHKVQSVVVLVGPTFFGEATHTDLCPDP